MQVHRKTIVHMHYNPQIAVNPHTASTLNKETIREDTAYRELGAIAERAPGHTWYMVIMMEEYLEIAAAHMLVGGMNNIFKFIKEGTPCYTLHQVNPNNNLPPTTSHLATACFSVSIGHMFYYFTIQNKKFTRQH